MKAATVVADIRQHYSDRQRVSRAEAVEAARRGIYMDVNMDEELNNPPPRSAVASGYMIPGVNIPYAHYPPANPRDEM